MECGGTEAHIKAGFLQHGFLKQRDDDRERFVWSGLPKKGCEA